MNNALTQPGAAATGPFSASAEGRDRDVELRRFVAEHPRGWDHDNWLDLLQHLRPQGHDVDDADSVGRELERQRLSVLLAQVRCVGLKRMQAITDRYPDVWSLRKAGTEGLVESVNIPASLAERIQEVE